jgi:hypothetical protein
VFLIGPVTSKDGFDIDVDGLLLQAARITPSLVATKPRFLPPKLLDYLEYPPPKYLQQGYYKGMTLGQNAERESRLLIPAVDPAKGTTEIEQVSHKPTRLQSEVDMATHCRNPELSLKLLGETSFIPLEGGPQNWHTAQGLDLLLNYSTCSLRLQ